MNISRLKRHAVLVNLVTFILITTFLCQNIAFAKTNTCLVPPFHASSKSREAERAGLAPESPFESKAEKELGPFSRDDYGQERIPKDVREALRWTGWILELFERQHPNERGRSAQNAYGLRFNSDRERQPALRRYYQLCLKWEQGLATLAKIDRFLCNLWDKDMRIDFSNGYPRLQIASEDALEGYNHYRAVFCATHWYENFGVRLPKLEQKVKEACLIWMENKMHYCGIVLPLVMEIFKRMPPSKMEDSEMLARTEEAFFWQTSSADDKLRPVLLKFFYSVPRHLWQKFLLQIAEQLSPNEARPIVRAAVDFLEKKWGETKGKATALVEYIDPDSYRFWFYRLVRALLDDCTRKDIEELIVIPILNPKTLGVCPQAELDRMARILEEMDASKTAEHPAWVKLFLKNRGFITAEVRKRQGVDINYLEMAFSGDSPSGDSSKGDSLFTTAWKQQFLKKTDKLLEGLSGIGRMGWGGSDEYQLRASLEYLLSAVGERPLHPVERNNLAAWIQEPQISLGSGYLIALIFLRDLQASWRKAGLSEKDLIERLRKIKERGVKIPKSLDPRRLRKDTLRYFQESPNIKAIIPFKSGYAAVKGAPYTTLYFMDRNGNIILQSFNLSWVFNKPYDLAFPRLLEHPEWRMGTLSGWRIEKEPLKTLAQSIWQARAEAPLEILGTLREIVQGIMNYCEVSPLLAWEITLQMTADLTSRYPEWQNGKDIIDQLRNMPKVPDGTAQDEIIYFYFIGDLPVVLDTAHTVIRDFRGLRTYSTRGLRSPNVRIKTLWGSNGRCIASFKGKVFMTGAYPDLWRLQFTKEGFNAEITFECKWLKLWPQKGEEKLAVTNENGISLFTGRNEKVEQSWNISIPMQIVDRVQWLLGGRWLLVESTGKIFIIDAENGEMKEQFFLPAKEPVIENSRYLIIHTHPLAGGRVKDGGIEFGASWKFDMLVTSAGALSPEDPGETGNSPDTSL